MSDLSMFDTTLEHRILEVTFYQWDGTPDGAMAATAALQRELPLRGASLDVAHHRATREVTRGEVGTNRFEIEIVRRSDGQGWRGAIERGQFLVMWLHNSRLHHVEIMDEEYGDLVLRPVNPVVRLLPSPPKGVES